MSNTLQKQAKALLKQGKSRQETFELLREEHKLAKDVADSLNYLPNHKIAQKYRLYGILQAVLLALLGLLIFLKSHSEGLIHAIPTLIVIAYFGFLIQASARMQIIFYPWVTFLMIIAIISGAVVMIIDIMNVVTYEAIIFFALSSVILAMSIWLDNKVCPKPKEIKETYTDASGRQRIRLRYKFED